MQRFKVAFIRGIWLPVWETRRFVRYPGELACLNYKGQEGIFSLIWFQCDWQLPTGVVPAHGVAMDTSLPWPEVPCQPLKHQFPSSSIGDEFNCLDWFTFVSL